MLTVKDLLRTVKMQSAFGDSEGSCFGVPDASRLRKSNYHLIKDYDKFIEDKTYIGIFNHEGERCKLISQDVELLKDYKVRIVKSFNGSNKAKETFFIDKIPYSDLETKTLYHIKKVFN